MNSAAGYQALIEQFDLRVIQHYRQSYIALRGRGTVKIEGNHEIHVYPNAHAVKDPKNPIHQLVFALKYDGVNLEILQAVFKKIAAQEIALAIHQHPGSKYIRVLWFLYEFLTDQTIKAPALGTLKYIDVLDSDRYFTSKGIRSPRHRVNNNLIGNKAFCPLIRKTKILTAHIDKHYDLKAKNLSDKYDPKIIARASYYLFTKETLSSYEIEREKPNKNRIAKFINVLQKSTTIEKLTKKQLLELQNIIVDPRFQDVDYRKNQNYIGENVDCFPRIHYISPRPENVESLMNGLLEALQLALHTGIHPVLIAAIISFGFVFIHPFEDGNGRIHRFLIHYILSKQKFTPPGIIFPVSAAMLKKIHDYDKILESFSKPIMHLISDYTLSDDGVLLVKQDTHSHYKYIDYTHFTEYLFACIEETLRDHFEREIVFLVNYDKTKNKIQEEIDMPDKLIDLFIKCAIQNKGDIGKQKRTVYFNKLTDQEINTLESIVRKHILDSDIDAAFKGGPTRT